MPHLLRFCVLLTFCTFLLPLKALFAQQIHGRVTDLTMKGLPAALITLQRSNDSVLLQSVLSDSNGYYLMDIGGASTGILHVSAAGYDDQSNQLDKIGDNVSALNFTLKSAGKQLAGVTVSGRKPLVEKRVDRTIFNIENSISTTGGDALDALKKAPNVRVNDNDISIAGKSSVSVMINDKLLQVSGDELANVLKSIPADNVSRIEIITTPPAKYDAAGNSGIINIITKKMLKNGLNGNATLAYRQLTSRAGGFNSNFNYRHNKLNIFGFANGYRAIDMPNFNLTTQYENQRWEQQSYVHNNNVFNRVQIGADYNLTPNTIIGLLYTLGNGGNQYNGDATIISKGYNQLTGNVDSVTNTRALTQDRGWRNVGNLNYQWKIDSLGKKLNIDLDYFTRTGKSTRDLNTGNFFADGAPTGFTAITRTSGTQKIDIRSGKIDIAWPTSFGVFAFGGKASFIHNTSDNLATFLDAGIYRPDTGKTNNFDYRENTQAIYGSGQKEFDKWEIQAGLRAEYTQTKSYSATLNQRADNDYFKVFPTLYVQYEFNEDHTININYSKRIDRPTFWDMNPFRTYFTSTSYSQGNPFLQPSFSNNIELSYVLKSKYNFSLNANIVDNVQSRVSFIDSVAKAYSFNMANVGKAKNFGASFNATFNPAKCWESVLSATGWYSIFSSEFYGSDRGYNRPAFTIETNNTVNLNKAKTLVAEVSFTYNSTQLENFDVTKSNTNLEAGIKALFAQKTIIIALSGYDIFRSEKQVMENQYNGTIQNNYDDERAVRLAITWKFGSNDIKAKRERAGGSEEENRVR